MFNSIYRNLLKIFPSINLPEKPIYPYIVERHYIATGQTLTGTSLHIDDNMVVVKANEVEHMVHSQYVYNESIIDVFIVPYNIDRFSFNKIDGFAVIYNMVEDICELYKHRIFSEDLKTIFKYAPFVIAISIYDELSIIKGNSDYIEILNILTDMDLTMTVDMIYDIIQLSIDDLLNKGKILPIIEQAKNKHNESMKILYTENLDDLNIIIKDEYEGII